MKKSVAKHVYEYGLLALGTLALGIGFHVFLLPIHLSAGGITTLGAVILHLTRIPLSVTNLVANVVLFAFLVIPSSCLNRTVQADHVAFFEIS